MKTVVSHRLILRPVRDEDLPFLRSLLGNEDRTRYLFSGSAMNERQTLAFITQYFTAEDAEVGMGVLTARQPEHLVGFAGIIATDCLGGQDFEFGFALTQRAERNDYATEIGCFQMKYAFETLHLPRILALVHPENSPSIHVVRDKLKMSPVAQVGQTEHRGPRIVFCRHKAEGLPEIHGKGWDPAYRSRQPGEDSTTGTCRQR